MHELSIAGAILDLAREHTPPEASLRIVHLSAGPLRGIDEVAMQHAWLAVTDSTPLARVELELTQLPWRDTGNDLLQVTSLTVEDEP